MAQQDRKPGLPSSGVGQDFLILEDPRPPGPKGGKKTTFLGACGAKLWGSGGAPPTNLILLRNQWSRALPVARDAA